MRPDQPTDPSGRFRSQLRVSAMFLVVLVLLGMPGLFSQSYALILVGIGLPWPLELSSSPAGFVLNAATGLLLGLAMMRGRLELAGAAACFAGVWGLFIVTAWFSLLALPFAYVGGLGISVLLASRLPNSPRLFQGVAFPATVLLVGSRAILVGPEAAVFLEHVIQTETRVRSKPAQPEATRCDDSLEWLCAPGLDLDVAKDGSIAVLSADGAVVLWDSKAKKRWRRAGNGLEGDPASSLLRFTSDGARLLHVVGNQAVLLDSATGDLVANLRAGVAESPNGRAFAPTGGEIVAAGSAWAFYDERFGYVLRTARSSCGAAQGVAPASTSGRYWAACGERLILWDSASGEERVVEMLPVESRVLSLGGATDGSILAHIVVPSAPGTLRRFSEDPAVASLELPTREKRPLRKHQGLRFDAHGRVAFARQGGARVLDAATGKVLWNVDVAPVQAVAWDAEERALFVMALERKGSEKGIVRRWPLQRE